MEICQASVEIASMSMHETHLSDSSCVIVI